MDEMYPIGPWCLLRLIEQDQSSIIIAGDEKADVRNEFEVLRVGPKVEDIKPGDRIICGPHIFKSEFRGGKFHLVEEKMVIAVVRHNPKAKKAVLGVTVATPYTEEDV
jgi:hypothetical protein